MRLIESHSFYSVSGDGVDHQTAELNPGQLAPRQLQHPGVQQPVQGLPHALSPQHQQQGPLLRHIPVPRQNPSGKILSNLVIKILVVGSLKRLHKVIYLLGDIFFAIQLHLSQAFHFSIDPLELE
jgi:hypothetical protein